MSLSSYIKRQSRAIRKFPAGLSSILEDSEESSGAESVNAPFTDKKTKKNSMKAKRRLGVSDLSIPRTSPLFTAVQDDSEWRLRARNSQAENSSDEETFDFPRPPMPSFESPTSELGESSSGSDSGMPTTPSPSPTLDAFSSTELGQCVIRCKSIKPLTLSKRSLSPAPSFASSGDEEGQWEDDEFYAAHASNFITITPPLPASFPASPSSTSFSLSPSSSSIRSVSTSSSSSAIRAAHRESAVIPAPAPYRASVRLNRPISIPSRAPPPPPIITSHPPSVHSVILNTPDSAQTPARPPPKTPLPTDAWSGDYTAFASILSASIPSSPSSSSSSSRLAALLSPAPRFPPEAQSVPSDVDADFEGEEGEWEECDLEFDGEYEELPLSPPGATSLPPVSPVIHVEAPLDQVEVEQEQDEEGRWTFPPSPLSPALASPNVSVRSRSSRMTTSPALRSRWSSSTLSSMHSAHAQVSSPKTFSFARRYLPKPAAFAPSAWSSATGKSPKSPAASSYYSRFNPVKVGKGKRGRLTAADVRVQLAISTSPASTTSSSPASSTSTSRSALSPTTPATPYSAPAQWAAYPASPAPSSFFPTSLHRAPVQQRSASASTTASGSTMASMSTSKSYVGVGTSKSPNAGLGVRFSGVPSLASAATSASVSPALYAAYTTQRSPRRRMSSASTASSAVSGWSFSTSGSTPLSPISSTYASSSSASSSPTARGVSRSRSTASSSSSRGDSSSDSGHSSSASSVFSGVSTSSGASGLRRKPIPVEMFLR
ncbi:hypothetical protein B0H16DRAFT_1558097 [Mycena metata]|uniref:Uncharacterized protein n=1 Tax=Mycena metata TaxID=1033252 RepID=A0AAD7INU7_9AGAR|nr:hypothetical protein B0H16DRAFT_1558097 [Mycena metata]